MEKMSWADLRPELQAISLKTPMLDTHKTCNSFKNLTQNGLTIAVTIRNSENYLPWYDGYWNIKITHIAAPDEIWATLNINDDLLAHATNTTDISALTPANDIVRNAIYIWKSATGKVFRVKIIECFDLAADIEHESAWQCNCFFIDIGKCATITCGKLYQLNDKFNRIAPQAICFRPYGFDELNNCPHINNLLTAWLLNRQFIAYIMMTEHQYYVQCDTNARTPKIDIALFKGHPRLTPLKPILFEQIGKSLSKAAINVNQTNVNVSYVCHSLVYFQIDQHCINYINALIQLIVGKNQLIEYPINRLKQANANANAIVLAYDKQRAIYVRAKILNTDNVAKSVYECFYIDYGDVRLVKATQIYQLDEMSFLNYLPYQAVPAKLNLLPNIDVACVERLRGIFQRNPKVQIEIVDRFQHLPAVNIFKREQQYRLHVNKLVQMENELQETTATLSDDDFEDNG